MRLATLVFALQVAAAPKQVTRLLPDKHVIRDTTRNLVVLHYDSSADANTTIAWLKKKHLAYHYLIQRDGTVVSLLDPKYQGAHAGLSYWQGLFRLNLYSIGVCLQNKPPQAYTKEQYQSLGWLLQQLIVRWPSVAEHRPVGHSDIAIPRGRKQDPGKQFDWAFIDSLHLFPKPPHA